MKKQKTKKQRFGAKSKMAFAATMLAVPMFATPQMAQAGLTGTVSAQQTNVSHTGKEAAPAENVSLNFTKISQACEIIGVQGGHTVYKNNAGKYFWIDPSTGNQNFLSADMFLKFGEKSSSASEWIKFKDTSEVTILGVDAKGHVIHRNSRGEKFYLNQANGDMIFVK